MFCELVFIYVTVQVQRINSADGKVKSVETDLGTVECQYFVNSAGQVLNLTRKLFALYICVSSLFKKRSIERTFFPSVLQPSFLQKKMFHCF